MPNPSSILITGASSGIGKALALNYANAGVTLHLGGRNQTRLDLVAMRCRAAGATVITNVSEVSDKSAMSDWIAAADKMAKLDLVIANAGISGGTFEGKEAAEQVRQIFDVNLGGVLNTVLPGLNLMLERKAGQIAIMSSLAGFLPLPGAPAYCASKAAVRQYGEALRISARRRNVRVSVICPGFVHSRLTAANQFTMPLIMSSNKAARIIADGLSRNRARIAFPWPMYAAVWLLNSAFPAILNQHILGYLPEKKPSSEAETY
tara:strand:+ start:784 stop:1572 length:789 start_codon:yes stop_codon:yes gene_type:complete